MPESAWSVTAHLHEGSRAWPGLVLVTESSNLSNMWYLHKQTGGGYKSLQAGNTQCLEGFRCKLIQLTFSKESVSCRVVSMMPVVLSGGPVSLGPGSLKCPACVQGCAPTLCCCSLWLEVLPVAAPVQLSSQCSTWNSQQKPSLCCDIEIHSQRICFSSSCLHVCQIISALPLLPPPLATSRCWLPLCLGQEQLCASSHQEPPPSLHG